MTTQGEEPSWAELADRAKAAIAEQVEKHQRRTRVAEVTAQVFAASLLICGTLLVVGFTIWALAHLI